MFSEIYEMQAEAIFQAVMGCMDKGVRVIPEIMIPLVGHSNELKRMRELVDRVVEKVLGTRKEQIGCKVGSPPPKRVSSWGCRCQIRCNYASV